jgi:hypothetical protein
VDEVVGGGQGDIGQSTIPPVAGAPFGSGAPKAERPLFQVQRPQRSGARSVELMNWILGFGDKAQVLGRT